MAYSPPVMATIGSILVLVFYALVVGSAGYFLHKVAWFFRYRRLQEEMVQRALEKLREQADTTVVRWDQGAEVSWSEASASATATPTDYVRRVEGELETLAKKLGSSHASIRGKLLESVREDGNAHEVSLLDVPQRRGPDRMVTLLLGFNIVPDPPVPAADTLALEMRSRYGFARRVLAFFLGVADVVYSSQHVVRMSQNPRTPVSIVLRRMSLVMLILGALIVDIGFGLRKRLVELVSEELPNYIELTSPLMIEMAPTVIALGIWLAGYGALYIGLYLFLRWRSGRYLRDLELIQATLPERIADIRDRHLEHLYRWTDDYGSTLDDAALLTMHQAEMLVQRTAQRLRRRVASPRLLDLSTEVATLFFAKLPESAVGLQDVASSHRHSWRHSLWPRRQEMRYQINIAQYRFAWRDIEVAVNSLRGELPDPELAGQLWRSLVRYARMFPDVVPDDLFNRLQEAHGATVETIVEATNEDLVALDKQLAELADALQHTVEAVSPLVESRIELTTRSMEAEVAAFVSEARRVRERARLEAMAFEI